jgi:hypothetical protein
MVLIMKYKILVYIALSWITCALSAQVTTDKKMWDYPVKPGMEEWAAFTTGKQMQYACQIPQKILQMLETKDLAEICMNYPLLGDYLAYNDERKGISMMVESFNGLKELSRRDDGAKELMQIYTAFPVFVHTAQITPQNYDLVYKLPFLELLLSDDAFTHQLSGEELTKLLDIVRIKYSNKASNSNVYSLYNVKRTFLLGAVVMDKQKDKTIPVKRQEVIKKVIENYNAADANLLTEFSRIISGL